MRSSQATAQRGTPAVKSKGSIYDGSFYDAALSLHPQLLLQRCPNLASARTSFGHTPIMWLAMQGAQSARSAPVSFRRRPSCTHCPTACNHS